MECLRCLFSLITSAVKNEEQKKKKKESKVDGITPKAVHQANYLSHKKSLQCQIRWLWSLQQEPS